MAIRTVPERDFAVGAFSRTFNNIGNFRSVDVSLTRVGWPPGPCIELTFTCSNGFVLRVVFHGDPMTKGELPGVGVSDIPADMTWVRVDANVLQPIRSAILVVTA